MKYPPFLLTIKNIPPKIKNLLRHVLYVGTSSQYEREFKSILEGNHAALVKVTKTCSAMEKDTYFHIRKKPFIVVRAAGSLGVDLVALRGDISFLVEIKSSNSTTLHFSSMSGKLQQQAERMCAECEKTKTLPIYAFRLKGQRGDSWRIFTIPVNGLQGRVHILSKRLPQLRISNQGHFIMRWMDGLPLSEFLVYLSQ